MIKFVAVVMYALAIAPGILVWCKLGKRNSAAPKPDTMIQ